MLAGREDRGRIHMVGDDAIWGLYGGEEVVEVWDSEVTFPREIGGGERGYLITDLVGRGEDATDEDGEKGKVPIWLGEARLLSPFWRSGLGAVKTLA